MEIFTSWSQYYEQLLLSLQTEDYGTDFPDYDDLHENGVLDEDIVEYLLETRKLDPQEGYDGFIDCLLNGSRYAFELEDEIEHIIDMFVEKGAKINFDTFFASRVDLEEDYASVPIRGRLIDITTKYGLDSKTYYDWDSVEESDWECIEEGTVPKETVERMYLKYWSKTLGGKENDRLAYD